MTALTTRDLEVLDSDSTTRTTVVRPGMCGPGSLFVGQIGDWTWDTVSALCGTNVYTARDGGGAPTYLAFYYYHVRASPGFHVRGLTFGDMLRVDSRVFGFGSESVLTLHEIRRGGPARRVDPDEFYAHPDPECLYAQNFNRWVARGASGGNEDLRSASPADFRHEHLPVLPAEYSPRRAYNEIRSLGALSPPADERARLTVDYPVDVTRDLNGVGLLYFAAYFSIVDWALLRLWRHRGGTDTGFLDRIVLDQKVCYLGNADAGTVLRVELSHQSGGELPDADETVRAVLADRTTGRLIAVAVQQVKTGVAG
ncbi:putative biosynthetic protein (TIGR04098 family) [Saccharothrix tamanrassetensis]|uniref:Putative biosynthetic protein (TIGR04098 family) n=1 Tax=Saccharothrix tamanrassetensis TaxID=1051531 RepID=A0A841C5G6_9PSEU|nr:LnmK family bifunctional acyltransferase/decarboxylase [Saccharothrix tamanrassetensis]MBB5953772.1 putative biosynthetic protein (TIGR04098 family) [Saccharothrix tamanrassetensis]